MNDLIGHGNFLEISFVYSSSATLPSNRKRKLECLRAAPDAASDALEQWKNIDQDDTRQYRIQRLEGRFEQDDEYWYIVLWKDGSRSPQLATLLPQGLVRSYNRKRGKGRGKSKRGGGPTPVVTDTGLVEHQCDDGQEVKGVTEERCGDGHAQDAALPTGYEQYAPLTPLQLRPPPQTPTHFRLVKSMCLIKAFSCLVGSQRLVNLGELNRVVESRGETVYLEGWHSVAQLNAYFAEQCASIVLCKAGKLCREKDFASNPFLREQRTGLFIIQARVNGARSKHQDVNHFVGVDCYARQFVDPYVQERRAITEDEWKLIGVKDWQQTFAICSK